MEIPVKKKHIAGKGIYGYPRQHNGRNAKKVKKIGSNGAYQPYDRDNHVRVVNSKGHWRMYHYSDAHEILGR